MEPVQSTTVLFLDCAPWFGGAQRSLFTVLAGLGGTPFRPVLVAADRTRNGLLAAAEEEGIECRTISTRHWRRGLSGVWQYAADRHRFSAAWRQILSERRPAIVHANGVRSALLALGPIPEHVALVIHARDLRLPPLLRRLVARRAACIIAASRGVAQCWLEIRGSTKVHVVPNGFQLNRIRTTPATAEVPWGECITAVQVADMAPWKRHELFLEALRAAQVTMPRLRGILVGRGLTRQGDERLSLLKDYAAALGLSGKVCFVSDAQDAVPWIAAADLLVSTSQDEPFGRVLVEALALGKPVVATAGAGPEEILADTDAGSIVESHPQAIADGIARWRDPARREGIADSARAHASRFNAERMVRDVCALYAELLGA